MDQQALAGSRTGSEQTRPTPRSPLAGTIAAIDQGQIVINCDQPALGAEPAAFAVPGWVRGWAFAEPGIASVQLTVDDGPAIEAEYGLPRSDVAVSLGVPTALRCGFEVSLDIDHCPPGAHTVTVRATDAGGREASASARIVATPGPPETIAAGEPSLDGGGERYVPELQAAGLVQAEHVARYAWAAGAATGRDVLDAGCGVGWGTLVLADGGARRVTGVDIDEPAIANARERGGDRTEFVVGDLLELPFETGSFDLVVSFEAIEHIEDPLAALGEFRRVLREDGLLIVSTPNRGVYWSGNPFHVHELTSSELERALSERFANVALRRQQTYLGSLVTDDSGFALADPSLHLNADLRKAHAATPGEELYVLGVASDGPLPALRDVACLSAPTEVTWFLERLAELEHRAALAEAELSATRQEVLVVGRRRDELVSLVRESDRALSAHRSSLSWRITAPLRALKRARLRRAAR